MHPPRLTLGRERKHDTTWSYNCGILAVTDVTRVVTRVVTVSLPRNSVSTVKSERYRYSEVIVCVLMREHFCSTWDMCRQSNLSKRKLEVRMQRQWCRIPIIRHNVMSKGFCRHRLSTTVSRTFADFQISCQGHLSCTGYL
jgi:hypothetical protein